MIDLDAQIRQLQQDIRAQAALVAALEAEIATLEAELGATGHEYNRIVQPVAAKLDAAAAAVAGLEQRQPAGEDARNSPPQTDDARVWQQTPSQRGPSPLDHYRPLDDPEAGLKGLYRALVRRFHPDHAADAGDAVYRNRMMVLINDAYNGHALDVLQALADRLEAAGPDVPLSLLHLGQLIQQRSDLEQRAAQLRGRYHTLLHSEMMRLQVDIRLARKLGRSLLREMADSLEQQYREQMARLEQLRRGRHDAL